MNQSGSQSIRNTTPKRILGLATVNSGSLSKCDINLPLSLQFWGMPIQSADQKLTEISHVCSHFHIMALCENRAPLSPLVNRLIISIQYPDYSPFKRLAIWGYDIPNFQPNPHWLVPAKPGSSAHHRRSSAHSGHTAGANSKPKLEVHSWRPSQDTPAPQRLVNVWLCFMGFGILFHSASWVGSPPASGDLVFFCSRGCSKVWFFKIHQSRMVHRKNIHWNSHGLITINLIHCLLLEQ